MLIELQSLSTWYILDIYFSEYDSNLSTEYVLDIYFPNMFWYLFCWYDSFYQCWYVLVFVNADMTPIYQHEYVFGYLSTRIELQNLSTVIWLQSINTNRVWIFIKLIDFGY